MWWQHLYEALSRKKPSDDDESYVSENETISDASLEEQNTTDERLNAPSGDYVNYNESSAPSGNCTNNSYTSAPSGCISSQINSDGRDGIENLYASSGGYAKQNDASGRNQNHSSGRDENEDLHTPGGNYANQNGTSAPSGRNRKRHTSASSGSREKLTRVLGLTDLTFLGIGSTLGLGVYILGGAVAKNQAGPAVIVSLLLAAAASAFSALCYVEFASRIFKAGSAYNYTYTSVGEFTAYVIGWNLVLEYVIGTASEAKAISNHIDLLLGNAYQNRMEALVPIHYSFLSTYPDFIAATIVLLMSGLIAYGVRESTRINSVLTFCNIAVVITIVVSGLFKVNLANWSITRQDIPANYRAAAGAGGFFPFGVNGVVVGAAKCFFGFVGFDAIATTGEEAKNPRRDIPLSILFSLSVVFVSYVGVAAVLTLIMPYYEQDDNAPFPHLFDVLGWQFMKWLVSIGSMFALMTGMFGALFPLPRILYSMSCDGLIYDSFAYVSPRTQTPIVSSLATGVLTAVLSAIFKLDQLVDMMSIGTLLAYTIVSLSVLLLRFSDEDATDDSIVCAVCNIDTNNATFKPVDTNNFKDTAGFTTQQNVSKSVPVGIGGLSNLEHINTVAAIRDGKLVRCDPYSQPSLIAKVQNRSVIGNERIEPTVLQVCETSNATVQYSEESHSMPQQCEASNSIFHNKPTPPPGEVSNAILTRYEDSSNVIFQHTGESKRQTYEDVLPSKLSNGLPTHRRVGKPNSNHRCKHNTGLTHRFRTVLNLNSPSSPAVTPTSQYLSKCCIYLFVVLTIVVCLVLNAVTGVDLGLESAPLPSNETVSPSSGWFPNYEVATPTSRTNKTLSGGLFPNYEGMRTSSNETVSRSSGVFANYEDTQIPRNETNTVESAFERFHRKQNSSSLAVNANRFENAKNGSSDFPSSSNTFPRNSSDIAKAFDRFPSRSSNGSNSVSTIIKGPDSVFNTSQASDRISKRFNGPSSVSDVSQGFVSSGVNTVSNISHNDFKVSSNSNGSDLLSTLQTLAYCVLGVVYLGTILVLSRQSQNVKRLNFRVPLVPLIPCLSIFLNVYLMVNLDASTWVRFVVWMVVGLCVYFTYGMTHSKLRKVTKLS